MPQGVSSGGMIGGHNGAYEAVDVSAHCGCSVTVEI